MNDLLVNSKVIRSILKASKTCPRCFRINKLAQIDKRLYNNVLKLAKPFFFLKKKELSDEQDLVFSHSKCLVSKFWRKSSGVLIFPWSKWTMYQENHFRDEKENIPKIFDKTQSHDMSYQQKENLFYHHCATNCTKFYSHWVIPYSGLEIDTNWITMNNDRSSI